MESFSVRLDSVLDQLKAIVAEMNEDEDNLGQSVDIFAERAVAALEKLVVETGAEEVQVGVERKREREEQ